MGYKVLKQGWRLIAILAIGFSSGCSGNEKIKGIDLDEVGYGSSVFSVLKGEDYESEALKLPEGVGEDIWLIWRLAVEASPKSKKAFVASS